MFRAAEWGRVRGQESAGGGRVLLRVSLESHIQNDGGLPVGGIVGDREDPLLKNIA